MSKTSRASTPLYERTIVITGASSGAGRAAAVEFAKHKANLVLASRNLEALQQLSIECRAFGAVVIEVQTDVTDVAAVKQLALQAFKFYGSIDIWINNAGVLAAGKFEETPVEIHHQVIKTNLLGYINGAHAVMPYFKKQGRGVLINNISVGAWFPIPYGVGYSASKYGLLGFSEALRGELYAWPNIHVCNLYPAFLDTPGIQHAANYTGSLLKPAPPVYDPQRVARAMVKMALHPKNNLTVGAMASLLRFTYFVAPGVSRWVTAKVMEKYFKNAVPATASTGNLFASLSYGTSIHGGWNTTSDSEQRKKVIMRIAAAAAIITALAVFSGKKS